MYSTLQRAILFLSAFTVPLQATQWSIGPFAFSATKLAVVLLVVLVGMQLLSSSHRRLPPDRSLLLLPVFGVSVLLSAFVNLAHGNPPLFAFNASLGYVGLIVLYLALLWSIRSRSELLAVLWGLVLGGAVAGFPALLAASSGSLFTRGDRFRGLAGQANTLAYELSIATAIAVGLYFTERSRLAKLLLVGAGCVMVLAIIGSLSRSALAALFVMWALWLVRSGRFDTLRYALPAILLAGIVFAFLPSEVHDRMATVLDPAQRKYDTGTAGRMYQAEWAFKAFLSNPITGVGAANFQRWTNAQPGGHLLDNTMHNSFLYLMATQGLLGLLPFLGLYVVAWRDYGAAGRIAAARRKRGDPYLRELGGYALFLQLALVGSAVGGLMHQESASKGLWIVFALSAVVLHLTRKRAEDLDSSLSTLRAEPSHAFGPTRDVATATG